MWCISPTVKPAPIFVPDLTTVSRNREFFPGGEWRSRFQIPKRLRSRKWTNVTEKGEFQKERIVFQSQHFSKDTGSFRGKKHSLKLTAKTLKMDGWKTTFLLGRPIFTCYVSFREGKWNLACNVIWGFSKCLTDGDKVGEYFSFVNGYSPEN